LKYFTEAYKFGIAAQNQIQHGGSNP